MKKTKLVAIGISVLIGAVCFSGCSDSSDSGAANESTVKHESKQKNKKSKEKVSKDKKTMVLSRQRKATMEQKM